MWGPVRFTFGESSDAPTPRIRTGKARSSRPATEAEQLAGETPFRVRTGQAPVTAFGKSCQTLEIGIIRAYSPQAKGRVERRNGLYQDRPRLGS